jgi:hypothetical protein
MSGPALLSPTLLVAGVVVRFAYAVACRRAAARANAAADAPTVSDKYGAVGCHIIGRVEALRPVAGSDRLGEFGERCGHPPCGRCVESAFVAAAAKVLHEGVPGDDHLRGPISL